MDKPDTFVDIVMSVPGELSMIRTVGRALVQEIATSA